MAAAKPSPGVRAQAKLERLTRFKVATTDLGIPVVPQEGRHAAALRKNLERVTLPPGFKVEPFAVVRDARRLAVAPGTNLRFVGTRKTTVWAVTDRSRDGVADEVKSFAPGLTFQGPGGVCRTGPDSMVYLPLGQPFNVRPRAKREVHARGIRSSVGHDVNPKDGSLLVSDGCAGAIDRISDQP